mgnify:CR=1 FL=1
MEEKHLLIFLIVALSLIVTMILFAILKNTQSTKSQDVRQQIENEPFQSKITIEKIVEVAADRKSTKNDLTKAIIELSRSFPFPHKIKGKVPPEGKIYLNFVLLIASHKSADAKLVAFMNTELKKKNEEYRKEIDIYESEGIRQRGKRIQ